MDLGLACMARFRVNQLAMLVDAEQVTFLIIDMYKQAKLKVERFTFQLCTPGPTRKGTLNSDYRVVSGMKTSRRHPAASTLP